MNEDKAGSRSKGLARRLIDADGAISPEETDFALALEERLRD